MCSTRACTDVGGTIPAVIIASNPEKGVLVNTTPNFSLYFQPMALVNQHLAPHTGAISGTGPKIGKHTHAPPASSSPK